MRFALRVLADAVGFLLVVAIVWNFVIWLEGLKLTVQGL